jgi:hypothetical protein
VSDTEDLDRYRRLVLRALRWADPHEPFGAHTSLRPYMTMVPKEKIGKSVDRKFWLGEVLDEIRRDAVKDLDPLEVRIYDRFVAGNLGYRENPCACDHPAVNPRSIEDGDAAVAKYKEFHRHDPRRVQEIDLPIPRRVRELGPAKHVLYRSGKVDPDTLKKPRRPVDYIHEHDAGVVAYACDGSLDTDVPEEFWTVGAVTVLGKCLGFALRDGTEAEGTAPLPDLCCTPDGKCLLVVQDKRKVLVMIWGGALGVFARGIDG